jgi:hypothetical protein
LEESYRDRQAGGSPGSGSGRQYPKLDWKKLGLPLVYNPEHYSPTKDEGFPVHIPLEAHSCPRAAVSEEHKCQGEPNAHAHAHSHSHFEEAAQKPKKKKNKRKKKSEAQIDGYGGGATGKVEDSSAVLVNKTELYNNAMSEEKRGEVAGDDATRKRSSTLIGSITQMKDFVSNLSMARKAE